MKLHHAVIFFGCLTLLLGRSPAFGKGTIVGSPHNLSASGQFAVKYAEETRICIFCHTPHTPKDKMLDNGGYPFPIWGHGLSTPAGGWTPYDSTTLHERPGSAWVPTGSSRLCLSCHDGTVALGTYLGSPITTDDRMPMNLVDPTKSPNFGTNLSNHHPISFTYPVTSELVPPAALPSTIKLDQSGSLQCTACHDPHNNEFGNFLVIDNTSAAAPLCVACHIPTGWATCTHNPQNSSYPAGGCMGCHVVHNAPVGAYLLNAASDGFGCFAAGCHDGSNPLAANIKAVVNSNRTPLVGLRTTVNKATASQLSTGSYHACIDCHNPHQSNNKVPARQATQTIKGPLRGVSGISAQTLGLVVARAEYEICFRCHSGGKSGRLSAIIADDKPNRMIREADQMRRFDGTNPSFHPVTADRRTNGASLLSQYQSAMIRIQCSDCHNSDQSKKAGGSGPNGPHGSRYEHLLMARYDMPPSTSATPPYSTGSFPSSYELCFRCHSDTYITGPQSGFRNGATNEHSTHVRDRGIPCFVCHDPHGVSAKDGATRANNSHLMNFDRSYATGIGLPTAVYLSTGVASGSCTVSCHSGSFTRTYSAAGDSPANRIAPASFRLPSLRRSF